MNGELTEAEDGGGFESLSSPCFKDELESNVGTYRSLVEHLSTGEDPSLHIDGPPSPSLNHEHKLMQAIYRRPVAAAEAADSTIASPSDHSTVSSPGLQSPGGIHTPHDTDGILADTQMSLIEDCARVRLDDTLEGRGSALWGGLKSLADEGPSDDGRIFRTVADQTNTSGHLDGTLFSLDDVVVGSSSPPSSSTFVSSAPSSSFIFTKFGKGGEGVDALDSVPSSSSDPPQPGSGGQVAFSEGKPRASKLGVLQRPGHRREPSLMLPFPWKNSKYELQILSQPEDQHRARYLTEGSRGAVKDITGQSHPMIKINGYDKPVVLQIFIGTDAGKVKPHGFYQACKVSGKNSTPCSQKDIQGTTVIEIQLEPGTDMTALVDCVGILKLRNADVEQRTKLCRSKKKSTKARMVFRVNVPKGDGFYDTLQIASTPILCTQPAGAPEVSKMSMEEGSVEGNQELFIIGKNFMKGTGVFFEETHGSTLTWSKEAELDTDYFQTTHLICKVPPYHDQGVFHNVSVDIVVRSSGKSSDPVPFTYKSRFRRLWRWLLTRSWSSLVSIHCGHSGRNL